MLNRIEGFGVNSVGFVPSFKSNKACPDGNCSNPVESNNLSGINALANYTYPMLKIAQDLDVEILKPIEIPQDYKNIDGEKIYTSDNKLHSIVKDSHDNVTTYIFDKKNPDKISLIKITDKGTGNVILKQEYSHEEADKYSEEADCIRITKYDKNSGKEINNTEYENNDLCYAEKLIYKPNGIKVYISKYKDGTYCVNERNKNGSMDTWCEFNKDKQLQRIEVSKQYGNKSVTKSGRFYKGALVSVTKSKEITIPNNMGVDEILNSGLFPAEKFNLDGDYSKRQGEKTYYSNGVIETNILSNDDGQTKVYFNPNGKVSKIERENKVIDFYDDGAQEITETFEDGSKMITKYSDKAELNSVSLESNGRIKELCYQDGKPSSYSDSPQDKDDNSNYTSLYFNKEGMLESAYSY